MDDPQAAKVEPSGGAQDSGETAAAPPMTFTELENKDYQMPSLDILADPKHTGQQTDKKNIYENANLIFCDRRAEMNLRHFRLYAEALKSPLEFSCILVNVFLIGLLACMFRVSQYAKLRRKGESDAGSSRPGGHKI